MWEIANWYLLLLINGFYQKSCDQIFNCHQCLPLLLAASLAVFQISNIQYQILNIRYQISKYKACPCCLQLAWLSSKYQISNIKHQISNIQISSLPLLLAASLAVFQIRAHAASAALHAESSNLTKDLRMSECENGCILEFKKSNSQRIWERENVRMWKWKHIRIQDVQPHKGLHHAWGAAHRKLSEDLKMPFI